MLKASLLGFLLLLICWLAFINFHFESYAMENMIAHFPTPGKKKTSHATIPVLD